MSVDDHLAKRDARIVSLWNDGMPASALATRFTLTTGGVLKIIARAKASGKTVREGQKSWA